MAGRFLASRHAAVTESSLRRCLLRPTRTRRSGVSALLALIDDLSALLGVALFCGIALLAGVGIRNHSRRRRSRRRVKVWIPY